VFKSSRDFPSLTAEVRRAVAIMASETKAGDVLHTLSRIHRNRELDGERGFTLIELLIVIVVLGILAAVVVFALSGVVSSGAASACATDAQSVAVAITAEQVATPQYAPVYASGTANGDLAPLYLATLPNSAYYTISMGSSNQVQVALKTGDPGYTTPAGVGVAAAPGATAENYNATGGSTIYDFPTSTGWPGLSYSGKGICAGA
jgi:general secretion pathway protein G